VIAFYTFMNRNGVRVAVVVITLAVLALLVLGCGEGVTTQEQFKKDCIKDNGTYTRTSEGESSCTFDNN